MKTLFTTKKAIALFDCKINNNLEGIRCHVYNLQQQLNYEMSFLVALPNITTKSIVAVKATDYKIELECTNGHTITYDYASKIVTSNEVIQPKNEFWGRQLLRLASMF